MGTEYKFGKLEDKLLRLCRAHVPDMEKIRAVVREGADVNAVDQSGRNLLTAVFSHTGATNGKFFPAIAEEFVGAGFDTARFGLAVMGMLVFSTYDRYIFDASMVLLKAGAGGDEGQWEQLLDAIGTEESYQRCCDEDHACENIYYAWYETVRRASEGKRFDDIGVWEDCIGLRVNGVIADANAGPVVSEMQDGRCFFRDQLILLCGEQAVTIEGNPNIYLCGRPAPEDLVQPVDLSVRLPFAVGSVIEKIEFEHKEYREGTTYYRQPNIRVFFDNGRAMLLTTNFGEVPKGETSNYVKIL